MSIAVRSPYSLPYPQSLDPNCQQPTPIEDRRTPLTSTNRIPPPYVDRDQAVSADRCRRVFLVTVVVWRPNSQGELVPSGFACDFGCVGDPIHKEIWTRSRP